jgi:prephenate dehydrogenase
MFQVGQITIVGTGLLGGSMGLALRAAGYGGRRVGVGRRAATVAQAQALGCIDRGYTDLRAAVASAGVATSQLVVLATPLDRFPAVFAELGAVLHERLYVTDVGSVKGWVAEEAQKLAPLAGGGARFVGSHPMAGREQQGPAAARADLFRGRPCVIVPPAPPPEGAAAEALRVVRALWTALGCSPILEMDAAEHDRAVARISHLPHALAALLVGAAEGQADLQLASTGFRDSTRVASGDPEMWADVFLANRAAALTATELFVRDLARFQALLDQKDRGGLVGLLQASKSRRDQWMAARREHDAPRDGET